MGLRASLASPRLSITGASPRLGLRLFCWPAESLAGADEIPQWPSNEERLPQPPTPFLAAGRTRTWRSTHTPRHQPLSGRQLQMQELTR